MEIQPIRPQQIPGVQPAGQAAQAGSPVNQVGKTFSQLLENLSESQNNSDALLQRLAAGENVDIHQVMIATEQTDIQFRTAVAIRDRFVEAYREVMRMNV